MHRYPLVSYLDTELTTKVRNLQAELRDLTGSQACLRDWEPHISVGSEVWLNDDEVENYVNELQAAITGLEPFRVRIHDFGFIDNWSGGNLPGNTPFGIFLHVEVTPPLQQLADCLDPISATRKLYFQRPQPYQPHVTLAFRDLDETGYHKAKKLLAHRHFDSHTTVDSISLAKMHSSGQNREFTRLPFTL